MDQFLPLFPLHTVLFPGATISLHIIEERYKLMIGRCIALKEPFGVVLVREDQDASGPAEPHDVGTTATITNVMRFGDGQMFISAEGKSRFRVQSIVQREPYLSAMVELIEEEMHVEQHLQARRLRELYDRYRRAISCATGVPQQLDDLPLDPVAMSFQLSSRLHVPHLSKQQLLEADLDTRLDALASALSDELRFLPPPSGSTVRQGNPWSLN